MAQIILIISIVLQLFAAIFALSLIKLTGRLWAWLIISSAIFLMVIRRSISLLTYVQNPDSISFSLDAELVALLTSLLLLVGISLFPPILKSFRKESENIYEQLLNAAPDTFAILFDENGRTLAINQQAREWLSQGNENYDNLFRLTSEVLTQPMEMTIEQLRETGTSIHHETILDDKWMSVAVHPLANNAGEIDKFAILIRDITKLKLSHEQQIEHEQQLMQADKLASLGILVTGIAHEINNPNQFIMSHITTIEKFARAAVPILNRYHQEFGDFNLAGLPYGDAKTALPQMIGEMRQGAERIQRIVSELRNFTLNNRREQHRPILLSEVVEAALVLLRNTVHKSTKFFTVSVDEGLSPVLGDFRQLEQVIVNLVTNASQALTSPDQSIVLSLKEKEESVLLIVDDSGAGISEENLKLVTDPFFTTKRDKGGTGLGLAVTKRIVEDHNGRMSFDSQPDAGTRVTIEFPSISKEEVGNE